MRDGDVRKSRNWVFLSDYKDNLERSGRRIHPELTEGQFRALTCHILGKNPSTTLGQLKEYVLKVKLKTCIETGGARGINLRIGISLGVPPRFIFLYLKN